MSSIHVANQVKSLNGSDHQDEQAQDMEGPQDPTRSVHTSVPSATTKDDQATRKSLRTRKIAPEMIPQSHLMSPESGEKSLSYAKAKTVSKKKRNSVIDFQSRRRSSTSRHPPKDNKDQVKGKTPEEAASSSRE